MCTMTTVISITSIMWIMTFFRYQSIVPQSSRKNQPSRIPSFLWPLSLLHLSLCARNPPSSPSAASFLQGPSGPGPNFSSARSRTSCKQLGMGLEPKTCLGRAKKKAGEHGWEGEDDQNCFHWWEHNKSYLYVLKTLYVSLLELNNNNNYYNKIWNPAIYIFIHSPVHMEKKHPHCMVPNMCIHPRN